MSYNQLREQVRNLINGIESSKTIQQLRERTGATNQQLMSVLGDLGAFYWEYRWYVPSSSSEAESHLLQEGNVVINTERQRSRQRFTNKALRDLARLQAEREEAEYFEKRDIQPLEIVRTTDKPGETAVLALASDWHVGARFRAEETNGFNAFDIDIATDRIQNYFSKLCDELERLRTVRTVTSFTLCLLGDMIEGALHEDARRPGVGTDTSPREQAEICQDLIAGGILELLNIFPKVHVVTTHGNHGRMTEKKMSSQGFGYSEEQFIYSGLAKEFSRRGSDVSFYSPPQKIFPVDVLGKKILVTHGDTLKAKSFSALDSNFYKLRGQYGCDYMIMGHFHYPVNTPVMSINGSLIGYTPFAYENTYPLTAPSQTLLTVTADEGVQASLIYL